MCGSGTVVVLLTFPAPILQSLMAQAGLEVQRVLSTIDVGCIRHGQGIPYPQVPIKMHASRDKYILRW